MLSSAELTWLNNNNDNYIGALIMIMMLIDDNKHNDVNEDDNNDDENWNHENKLGGERISFRGPSASCRDIGLTLCPEIYFPEEEGNHKFRGLTESQVNCTSKKMQIVSNK